MCYTNSYYTKEWKTFLAQLQKKTHYLEFCLYIIVYYKLTGDCDGMDFMTFLRDHIQSRDIFKAKNNKSFENVEISCENNNLVPRGKNLDKTKTLKVYRVFLCDHVNVLEFGNVSCYEKSAAARISLWPKSVIYAGNIHHNNIV